MVALRYARLTIPVAFALWVARIVWTYPVFSLTYTLVGVVHGVIYALIGLGFATIYRIGRFINFCHGDVFMLGTVAATNGFRSVVEERLGLAQPLRLLQHRARVLEQRAAGLRRRYALASAHQQRRAQRALHVADARGRRGERKMRALCAVRDAARFHDMTEQAEIGEVETHEKAFARCWAQPSQIAKDHYQKSIL